MLSEEEIEKLESIGCTVTEVEEKSELDQILDIVEIKEPIPDKDGYIPWESEDE